ncbi:hypothetical protein PR048_026323 [Dryococelus australis]|uniref:Uncharacterized protein n=1 Tax=Dryococelus australis TaxID=614101 RepID=A0ABQ9GL19_9NEOP|nr:hypothetical protein PR048_026323 [Dryococelus australis]
MLGSGLASRRGLNEARIVHPRNAGVEGNRRSPRKPADQRHRPARFPLVKIRECPAGGIGPGSRWGEASSLTAQPHTPLPKSCPHHTACTYGTSSGDPVIILVGTLEFLRVIEVNMERRRNEGAGKREIPEKTRRPTASSGTIPTCERTLKLESRVHFIYRKSESPSSAYPTAFILNAFSLDAFGQISFSLTSFTLNDIAFHGLLLKLRRVGVDVSGQCWVHAQKKSKRPTSSLVYARDMGPWDIGTASYDVRGSRAPISGKASVDRGPRTYFVRERMSQSTRDQRPNLVFGGTIAYSNWTALYTVGDAIRKPLSIPTTVDTVPSDRTQTDDTFSDVLDAQRQVLNSSVRRGDNLHIPTRVAIVIKPEL